MALATGTRPQDWLELPEAFVNTAVDILNTQAKAQAKAEARAARKR